MMYLVIVLLMLIFLASEVAIPLGRRPLGREHERICLSGGVVAVTVSTGASPTVLANSLSN